MAAMVRGIPQARWACLGTRHGVVPSGIGDYPTPSSKSGEGPRNPVARRWQHVKMGKAVAGKRRTPSPPLPWPRTHEGPEGEPEADGRR